MKVVLTKVTPRYEYDQRWYTIGDGKQVLVGYTNHAPFEPTTEFQVVLNQTFGTSTPLVGYNFHGMGQMNEVVKVWHDFTKGEIHIWYKEVI